jgi:isoleucyl-tRNA synthetase
VGARGWDDLPDELRRQLADELNVVTVEGLGAGEHLVDVVAKPSFRELGRRFGPRTPLVAAAVAAADPTELAAALRDGGRATVVVEGEPVEVGPDEVVLTETPREGWAVSSDGGETVALDLQLTPELRRAGLARDVVRTLQEARKNAGLEVTDRIEASWWAPGELAEAVREHASSIAEEVLAVAFAERAEPDAAAQTGWTVGHDAETGLQFAFQRASG